MRKFIVPVLVVAAAVLGGAPREVSAQSCTQTISAGANVAATVAAAAAGSTVCLNSGSYGSVTLSGIVKNPRVTVRSTSGQGAAMTLTISGGTNGLTVSSVTVTGGSVQGATTRNITVENSSFKRQYSIITTGMASNEILFDNNTHVNIDRDGSGSKDGRLAIYWPGGPGTQPCGVTVRNSLFENLPPYHTGNADGVEIGANGVVFGPGNTIRGIQQNGFAPEHTDGMQLYGQRNTVITGNLFIDNEVNIGSFDGGNTETITHNVFHRRHGVLHPNNVFLSIGPNGTIVHNVFKDVIVSHGAKAGHAGNANHLWQDNIFVNSDLQNYNSDGNGACVGCVYNNNLFDFQSTPRGTNQLLGSPTFVGGASPSTWAGFELAAGSLGTGAAVNPAGTNLGPNVSTAGNPSEMPPAAPSGLRISGAGEASGMRAAALPPVEAAFSPPPVSRRERAFRRLAHGRLVRHHAEEGDRVGAAGPRARRSHTAPDRPPAR